MGRPQYVVTWMKVVAGIVLSTSTDCGGGSLSDRAGPQSRDSAGIRIREYPAAPDAPVWELQFDTAASEAANFGKEWYRIRTVRWLDSLIVIANSGSNEIVVLDQSGTVRERIGREGEGPGEFRGLASVDIVAPDSILAYDGRLRRFQLFDSVGRLTRIFDVPAIDEARRSPLPIGVLSSRQLIVGSVLQTDPFSDSTGVIRSTIDILSMDLSGRVRSVIGTVPSWEAFNLPPDPGRPRVLNTPIPFGANTLLDVLGDRLTIGSTDRNEITVCDSLGRVRLIIRDAGRVGPPITDQEANEIKADNLSRTSGPLRTELARVYEEMPMPERRPGIREIKTGQDGTIWVSSWPQEPRPQVPFRVFNGDGDLIGRLNVPEQLNVTAIRAERLIGIWTDSLDVESIRVYRIGRPGTKQ